MTVQGIERTKFLESQGYKVIRFWNNNVMNDINGVTKAIQFALESETHVWMSAQARALREEAEREWQSAKENFEKALLG